MKKAEQSRIQTHDLLISRPQCHNHSLSISKNCFMMFQSWSYLAQYQYYETSKLERLFSAINEVSDDQVDRMSQHELSLMACSAAFKALFPLSYIQVSCF